MSQQQDEYMARVGDAWAMHRAGQNREAIAEFEKLLAQKPQNVDARYGLGLAQRADGQREAALQTFQLALTHSDRILSGGNDKLSTTETEVLNIQEALTDDLLVMDPHDRTQMLKRMIEQRIAELSVV